MRKAANLFDVDAPSVTSAEAITLCVHHLRLASMYYEGTPDGDNDERLKAEIYLQCKDDDLRAFRAAVVWVRAASEYYEALEKGKSL